MAGESNDFTLADPRANEVLQKLRGELAVVTPWRYLSHPVGVTFAVKNVSIEVQHSLGEIPDGVQVLTADCAVKRTPGKQWTKTLAYLMSDTDNSHAELAFGVYRESVTNVATHP